MAEVEVGKRLELLEIADSPRARRTARDLGNFLNSCERQAQLSRQERLRIVEQALLLMEMNYVHLPMKRAIHAIDPIQQLKLLRFQLAEWNAASRAPSASIGACCRYLDRRATFTRSTCCPNRTRTTPPICHFSSNSVSSEAPNDSSSLGRRPVATRRRLPTMVMGQGSSLESRCWVGTASLLRGPSKSTVSRRPAATRCAVCAGARQSDHPTSQQFAAPG